MYREAARTNEIPYTWYTCDSPMAPWIMFPETVTDFCYLFLALDYVLIGSMMSSLSTFQHYISGLEHLNGCFALFCFVQNHICCRFCKERIREEWILVKPMSNIRTEPSHFLTLTRMAAGSRLVARSGDSIWDPAPTGRAGADDQD